MSKKVRYLNGYEGIVSDKVAVILEKKAQAEILGDAKKQEPKKPAVEPQK